jgi:hypothetical protein
MRAARAPRYRGILSKEFPMLRKLILLAITSGLAKKAYTAYRTRQAQNAGMPTRTLRR